MLIRPILIVAAVAAGLFAASSASAASGRATGNVNMRTCGSVSCPKITVIPAGAQVEVISCGGWCELYYGGYRGFASARYIQVGYYQPAPTPPPVYRRPPMPPQVYWYYGQPWWDDRYHSWYDGRRWWYNNRWYNRPPSSGFTFEFRF